MTIPQRLNNRHQDAGSAVPWVVQKYGGTSIGKYASKIANDIIRRSLQRNRVAVVCSACSAASKAEGTTSQLLRLYTTFNEARIACHDRAIILGATNKRLGALVEDHLVAAGCFIRNPAIRRSLADRLRFETQKTLAFLADVLALDHYSEARVKDQIISVGEKLGCLLMCGVLEDTGVDNEYVDLSSAVAQTASQVDDKFYAKLTAAIAARLVKCGDRVPVITGFFGQTPTSLLDGEVGRGYTDLCATLCAISLGADELQIWKEVDGILTADPFKVPGAQPIECMTLGDVAALTLNGAEVVHAAAIQQLIKSRLPILVRIKNVTDPDHLGTVIIPDVEVEDSDSDSHASGTCTPCRDEHIGGGCCAAITVKDHVCALSLQCNGHASPIRLLNSVLGVLDKHSINISSISTSAGEVNMALCLNESQLASFRRAKEQLSVHGQLTVLQDSAIITLIGTRAGSMSQVTSQMLSILSEENIHFKMISQQPGHRCISCVIQSLDIPRAINTLHARLCLPSDPAGHLTRLG